MSVIKFNRNFSNLFNWDTDANPTTQQDYQSAVQNWTEIEKDIVDTLLWQPETEYLEDNIVKTPSLPLHYVLKCTTGGTSGATEPNYENVELNDSVTDGTVEWAVTKLTVASDIPVTADKADVDATNIGVNAEVDNSELWGSAIGGGAIANDDGKLVTGGTVYAVTNSMANSITANATAIATNTSAIATNTENIATNTANIATNTNAIATNTDAIAANVTAIGLNADAITEHATAIEANADAIEVLGERVDENDSVVEKDSKRIDNIEALLKGTLYNYQTDSTSAYTKTVPTGAMPYAGIEQIGGKTVVWNQDIPITTSDWSKNRCSVSVADDVYTLTCTAKTYPFFSAYRSSTVTSGHKYLYICEFKVEATNTPSTFEMLYNAGNVSVSALNTWLPHQKIYTATSNVSPGINMALRYSSAADVTVGDKVYVRNVMKIDLTLMFGAGNEPSTVSEFTEMFGADYYSYNAGTLLSAGVDNVVSKDSNNATLQTYPIPASIQSLEGYGWSAGSVSNYIDFENKKFVQNVARVDLGTLTWNYQSLYQYFYSDVFSPVKIPASTSDIPNIVSTLYAPIKSAGFSSTTGFVSSISSGGNVLARNENYTSASAFTSAMNGVYLYYELATPVEVDISAYLTDDNLIEVEAGGTITCENSNGSNYKIPVPSEVTYMVDLQNAIS